MCLLCWWFAAEDKYADLVLSYFVIAIVVSDTCEYMKMLWQELNLRPLDRKSHDNHYITMPQFFDTVDKASKIYSSVILKYPLYYKVNE